MLYIKDNIIRDSSRITIEKDGYIIVNPTADMLVADGWVEYTPSSAEPKESIESQMRRLILDGYNARVDLTDGEALDKPLLIYDWSVYVGKSLKQNQCVSYSDSIYRVRQDIDTVLENQYPSVDTAALYEVIELQATGTIDDPIEFVIPMEIFKDKYYVYNGVKYKCTRDSQTALNAGLDTLVDIYVTKVE